MVDERNDPGLPVMGPEAAVLDDIAIWIRAPKVSGGSFAFGACLS